MGKLCSPKSLVMCSGVGGREAGWQARGPYSEGKSGEGTRAKNEIVALRRSTFARSTSVQPSLLGSVMIGNGSKSRRKISLTLRARVSSSAFPASERRGTTVDHESQKRPSNLTDG